MPQAEAEYEMPDLCPGAERAAHGEQDFVRACMAHIHRNSATRHMKLGNSLLTRSAKWGPVLRIDFEVPGQNFPPLINRIVCWQTRKPVTLHVQYAIGQDIPPLTL